MALKIRNVREEYRTESIRTIKILVAGPPGAGKTRTASTWPNPLYADAEGRLLSVRDRDVHSVSIDSIAKLDELRAALAQEPQVREKILGVPVDTIILDTVDEIAKLVMQERLRSEKQETMRMADWGYLGDTLRSLLRGYRNLPLNVVLNVHVKAETDSESGRMWEKPAIQGQVGDEIAAYVDIAVLMVARSTIDPKTGERVPQRHFQTYQDSSHTWVKDHSGRLPPEFPINLDDDYARMGALIFGVKPTPDAPVSSPIATATMATSGGGATTVLSPAEPAGKVVGRQPRLTDADGKGRTMTDTPLPDKIPEASAPLSEGSVPTPGTEPDLLADLGATTAEQSAAEAPACADCGEPVTNPDQVDISMARWKVPLCRSDFASRKTRKK